MTAVQILPLADLSACCSLGTDRSRDEADRYAALFKVLAEPPGCRSSPSYASGAGQSAINELTDLIRLSQPTVSTT